MDLALTLLLWMMAALLAALVLLLAMPLRFRLSLVADPPAHIVVSVRPFGGLCPPLRLVDTRRKAAIATDTAPKTRKAEKPEKLRKRRDVWRRPANLRMMLRSMQRLLGKFRIDSLSVDGEFGLGDPCDTGQLFGLMTPLIYGTAGSPHHHVSLRPNFDRACLSGVFHTTISVTPLALAPPMLAILWAMFGPGR